MIFFYYLINELKVYRGIYKGSGIFVLIKRLIEYHIYYYKFIKNKTFFKKKNVNFEYLKKKKKSDTVFILGSGSSLNKITKKQWGKISKHNTIGFTNTIRLQKVNIDYHIHRASHEGIDHYDIVRDYILFFQNFIKNNNFMINSIILFPSGVSANFTNLLFGEKLYRLKNKFFFFNTNRFDKYPKKNISYGLLHRSGTLIDAISLAYFLGFKKIVLAGVDLYNMEYFFTKKNKTFLWNREKKREVNSIYDERNRSYKDNHATVKNGVINDAKDFKNFFKKKNIELFVLNKKSILAKTLKVYKI